MKLKRLEITNYKVFQEYYIDFTEQDINILIGKSNSGKSTVLEILNLLDEKSALKFEDFNKDATDHIIRFVYLFEKDEARVQIDKEYVVEYDKQKVKAPKILINNSQVNKNFYLEHNVESGRLDLLLQEFKIPKIYYMNPNSSPGIFTSIARDIIKDRVLREQINLDLLNRQLNELLEKNVININSELGVVNERVNVGIQKVFSTAEQLNINLNIEDFIIEDLINKININIDFEEMSLLNQGTEFQRILILTLIKYSMENNFIENKLLLIDEPEAYLHPQAIREVSNLLYEINGIQTIISTHSPVMVNITREDRSIKLMRVEDVNNQSFQTLYEETGSLREVMNSDVKKKFQLHNIINPYLNEFFFTNKIILVEGDVEELLFKTLLELDQFSKFRDTKIVNTHGKDTIVNYMCIINNVNIAYSVLTDLDNFRTKKNGDVRAPETIRAMKTKTNNIYRQLRDESK